MTESSPWHANRHFWERFQSFIFPPAAIEKAPEQVDDLLSLVDVDAGADVLDVPCGVGRHAVELADRGFAVTGVDATAPYLETARARAEDAGVDVEFVEADMREFRRPSSCDLAISLYTSFGYFEDRADDERVLENVAASLRPGGTLLLSLTSKEVLADDFEERTWHDHDDGYVLEERQVTDGWNWVENRWIVVEDGEVEEFEVSHRLYSGFELAAALEDAGFATVTLYGSLDGDDYDQDADQLVAVAER
ncbi:MAG: class I SAM-dependent methyltransferase [Halobacteriaceae archaeon]